MGDSVDVDVDVVWVWVWGHGQGKGKGREEGVLMHQLVYQRDIQCPCF